MWPLKSPSINSNVIECFDLIVGAKRSPSAAQLNALRGLVEGRCRWYVDNTNSLRAAAPTGELQLAATKGSCPDSAKRKIDRNALLGAYDDPTEPLQKVKNEIKSIQNPVVRNLCPYCGISEPNTTDHILPKSIFPEFAVLPQNLVMVCGWCNSNKGDVRWTEVLMSYYDDIDMATPCLRATIEFSAEPVDVKFDYRDDVVSEYFSRIKLHCNRLNILNRWSERAAGWLQGYLRELRLNWKRRPDVTSLKADLSNSYESRLPDYGADYWETAALYALAEASEALVDWLESHP